MVRGVSYKFSWSTHKYSYNIQGGAKIMDAFTTTVIAEPIILKDKHPIYNIFIVY